MIKVTPQKKKALRVKILERYKDNARDLPWRRTNDPYKILVSEVMSQQTQVERVKPKYAAWLKAFPTLEDAASASQSHILTLRSGLGYNRRGLNLWKALKQISQTRKELKDKKYFPQTEKDLLVLPGVGLYTAHAVLAFAYNQPVPVLDINIRRVLVTELQLDPSITDKELRALAEGLIRPGGSSRDRHNALMDYGALILTSKKTGIRSAPQSQFVGSRRRVRGSLLKLLIKSSEILITQAKKQYPHEEFDIIVSGMVKEGLIVRKSGKIKLVK